MLLNVAILHVINLSVIVLIAIAECYYAAIVFVSLF
jgi:hypothetical protein